MTNNIHKLAVRGVFNNFVMVNGTLVKHFRDANPALLIGYLIGEETYVEANGKLDTHGYFYCKVDKIQDKFGFGKDLQSSILTKLVATDLIEVFNKRIDGSESISKVRHFKLNHTAIFNLVNGIIPSPVKDDLPDDLSAIKQALVSFTKDRGATFVVTGEDEHVLKVARMHGLTGV